MARKGNTAVWLKFRSWPLWAQIVGWALLWPVVWTVWVVQKKLWPRWVRAGLVAAAWGFVVLVATSSGADPNKATIPSAEPSAAKAAPPQTTTTETTTASATTTEAAPPPPLLVSRVIDGDTIDLDNGDRIRLVQIDAPERDSECYGAKSGRLLRRLLPAGTEVRLEADRSLDNVDRYGRLLRYVFMGKRNINLVLVERGAANPYFYEGERGRFAGKLVAAADRARHRGKGAWGACDASTDVDSAWTVKQKPKLSVTTVPTSCHPSYEGACLKPNSPDYDCKGGSGNGPDYTGPVRVVGPDVYDLDADHDGSGCE